MTQEEQIRLYRLMEKLNPNDFALAQEVELQCP